MPFQITISAQGRTHDDALDAVDEAVRRLRSGFTSGLDRSADSEFSFHTTEHEPEED